MNPPQPPPDLLATAWPRLPLRLRLHLACTVALALTPFPVLHALATSLLAFLILALLPPRPLSIPTALGLALSLTLTCLPLLRIPRHERTPNPAQT